MSTTLIIWTMDRAKVSLDYTDGKHLGKDANFRVSLFGPFWHCALIMTTGRDCNAKSANFFPAKQCRYCQAQQKRRLLHSFYLFFPDESVTDKWTSYDYYKSDLSPGLRIWDKASRYNWYRAFGVNVGLYVIVHTTMPVCFYSKGSSHETETRSGLSKSKS